jgi:hypothetical protein
LDQNAISLAELPKLCKRQRLPSSLLIENASARVHVFATTLSAEAVSDEG